MARKNFPVLYGTTSKGKTKIFKIYVDQDDLKNSDVALITMEHGEEGGKMAANHREIKEGKNLGKKNATTPFEQAVSDAQSKWNKKKDEGYTETKKAQKTLDLLLPMLAQKYTERKHDIKFPCYVQPKLDGVRCLASSTENCEPYYSSRGGKPFTTLEHLDGKVHETYYEVGYVLDGEIYCHNEISFQDIVAAVKKTNENTPKLKYYIYDLAAAELTFEQRNKLLKDYLEPLKDDQLVYLPTYEVKNEAEIIKYHEQFVQDGYEGIIIRNKDGLYTINHRSKDLQKWKNFDDDEFEIIGGKQATGDDIGTIIFRCKTKEGVEFDVRPRGSREQRKIWFNNLKSLISKKLTVRYQGKSDENCPRFPVGISIRDYEG